MADLTVARAVPADEAAWTQLLTGYAIAYAHSMTPPMASQIFRGLLSPDRTEQLLIARKDGQPIGFVCYTPVLHLLTGRKLFKLLDMYIAPEARGEDAGRHLIKAVIEAARAEGGLMVRWQADTRNVALIRYFDKMANRIDSQTYEVPVEPMKDE